MDSVFTLIQTHYLSILKVVFAISCIAFFGYIFIQYFFMKALIKYLQNMR
ncbi:hypothetical protein ACFS5M_11505 [Lacinutrix iliipiscaria]|uniref:Uncharacterized protein n=1 Tax=Lacinutrix iliipiscaria TaxID=1230532 RepID=A0ABW5WNI1_9FLAO